MGYILCVELSTLMCQCSFGEKALALAGHITFKSDVTVTGPEGVLMDEGVTINNVDISSLLDSVEGIGKLMVSDPVTFNDPLMVSRRRKAVCVMFHSFFNGHSNPRLECVL